MPYGVEKPQIATSFYVELLTDKAKVKFITQMEKIIRSSLEYRELMTFLKDNCDFSNCKFYVNITASKKVKIEIHHTPFTLFDICSIVLNKWDAEGKQLNAIMMAKEVMLWHYKNFIGLVPLSITVHHVIHGSNDGIKVPLPFVYGKLLEFLKEYEEYIPDNLFDKFNEHISFSKTFTPEMFALFTPDLPKTKELVSSEDYLKLEGFEDE
jgi:hypothetical protein